MLPVALRNLFSIFSGEKKYRRSRVGKHRRSLKLEQLENRQLLATDLATITGIAYNDTNDDGTLDVGEARLSGVTVSLFEDVDNDGVFEPGAADGAAIATDTTDAQGRYDFIGLEAGRYFVRQTAGSGGSTGLVIRDTFQTIVVSSGQAAGVMSTIDDMTVGLSGGGAQQITAAPGATDQSGSLITGVLGGERDLFIENDVTSGVGANMSMVVDGTNNNVLQFSIDDGATGTLYVIYDGAADTLPADKGTVDPTGLGGEDITEAGTRTGFRFLARTDTNLGPVNLIVTVFDGTNQDSVTVAIPVGVSAQEVIVNFADFTGVDLTNVGAIRLEIDTAVSADGAIEFAGTIGPTLIAQDLINLNPMSLGDRVFNDLNNNGVLDSGETGIAGVDLQLFLDADGDGTLDVGETAVLDSSNNPVVATTNATGNYLFTNLLPNSPVVGNPSVLQSYIVVIANNQTELNGLISSTGNNVSGSAPDPNNDVNSDDNGNDAGANTVSGGIRLVAGAEPINDGDTDANTNLTLDFGFTTEVDMAIVKSGTATIDAGGNITYTLTVTNNSALTVNNIVVTDDLPTGVTFLPNGQSGSTSSAAWVTQSSGPELRAAIASLAAGANQVLTVVVRSDATLPAGTLNNVANVTSDGVETDTSDNQDDADTAITRNAVLTLTKSDGTRTTVSPGEQFTYVLTVTNTGVSTANNVTLTDLLPVGYSFVSFATGSQGNPQVADVGGRDQITAGVTSLAVGATMVVNIVVSVDTGVTGTSLVNSATADSDDSAPVTASDTNTITRNLDLNIVKTVSAPTVGVGGQVTYTLTVTNDGPSAVTGVEVDDDLPTGFTLATVGNPSGVTSNADGFLWVVGDLDIDETATITVIVDVATSVVPGTFTNEATIAVDRLTGFTDTNSANDVDTVDVTVQPRFDLLITKDDSLTNVTTGQLVTYTLTVDNDGPSAATNVVVTDALPLGLEFVSATSNSASIGSINGQTFSATIPTLASGETRTISLVVRVRPSATGSTIDNTSTVTADNASTQETGTRPNSATDSDTLTRQVTLNIIKNDSADPVMAGATFNYVITAFNSGTSDAPNVLFSDPLPAGVTFVSGSFIVDEATDRTGTVTFNSQTNRLEANLGTLLAGGSSTVNEATITLVVTVAGTQTSQLSNTATLTSPDNTTGVSDTETTTVNTSFDLTVTKDDGVTTVPTGNNLVYTVVVSNAGPSTATGITVTDVLPTNLTFVSATSSAGTFTNTNGTVSGTIASLAGGSTATITITARVNNDVPEGTVISNTASVAAGNASGETNTNNNSATHAVTVRSFGSIAGLVYIDANRNGLNDTGDLPLSGVTVELTGTATGSTTPITPIRLVTGADGTFNFTNVSPGNYSVRQIQPTGYIDGTDAAGNSGGTVSNDLISNFALAASQAVSGITMGEIAPFSKRAYLT